MRRDCGARSKCSDSVAGRCFDIDGEWDERTDARQNHGSWNRRRVRPSSVLVDRQAHREHRPPWRRLDVDLPAMLLEQYVI